VTDAAPATPALRFLVRSELMEYSTVANVLSASPTLGSAIDGDGNPQVFSLGTDGDLYAIFADPETLTGWGVSKLRAPTTLVCFAAGRDLRGDVVVFAAGANNHVYWMSSRRWSTWRDLGLPLGLDCAVKAIKATIIDGQLVAMAQIYFAKEPLPRAQVVRIDRRGEETSWDYVSSPLSLGSELYDFMPGAAPTGHGAFVSASMADRNSADVLFYEDQRRIGRTFTSSKTENYLALDGVQTANGETALFLLDSAQAAWFLDTNESRSDTAPVQISGSATLLCIRGSIQAGSDGQLLEAFGVGTNGNLYLARQHLVPDGSGGLKVEWGQMLDLGGELYKSAANLTVCRDAQGHSQCFAVGSEGSLVQFWENEDREWKIRPVTVAYDGEVVTVPGYTTDIGLIGAYDVPLVAELVTVATSVDTRATINGRTYSTGPHNPIQCRTNAAGRVTVAVATSVLGTPSITVKCGALSPGDVLSIRPDRYIQDELLAPGDPAALQTMLINQQVDVGGTMQPLIPLSEQQSPDFQTNMTAASAAIYQGLALGVPVAGDAAQSKLLVHPRGDLGSVCILRGEDAKDPDRIDTERVPDQHWSIGFAGGKLRYRRFQDGAEAEAAIAALRSRALADSAQAKGSGDFFHKPDWGDLWRSVRRGAATLVEAVVSTKYVRTVFEAGEKIVKQIGTAIHVMIDSVTHVFDYVMGKVQQVFDLVGAVFDAIAVPFQRLFQWLGSLFDWSSILLVKNTLKAFAGKGMQGLSGRLTGLQSTIDAKLTELIEKLAAGMNLGEMGEKSLAGEAEAAASKSSEKAPGPSTNWVETQIVNAQGGAGGLLEVSKDVVDGMLAVEKFLGDTVSAVEATFLRVWTSLSQWMQEKQRDLSKLTAKDLILLAGKLATEGVLTLLQTMVNAVFAMIQAVLQGLSSFIQHEWHVPVLSKLYEKISGSPLSLLDALCLAVAVPATVATKLLYKGTLPFTSDVLPVLSSLTPAQFLGAAPIDSATRSQMLSVGLLQTRGKRAALAEGSGDDVSSPSNWLRTILGFGYSGTLLVSWVLSGLDFVLQFAGSKLRIGTRLLACASSIVTLLLSFVFYFEDPKLPSEIASVIAFSVLGLQVVLADIVPVFLSIPEYIYNQPIWNAYHSLPAISRPGALDSLKRSVAMTVCTVAGALLSFVVWGAVSVQALFEAEELGKAVEKKGGEKPSEAWGMVWIMMKWVQNLLASLDKVGALAELGAEKNPQFAAIAFFSVTGVGAVGASTLNAIRAVENNNLGIPHLPR
jgi:hypothetical protein